MRSMLPLILLIFSVPPLIAQQKKTTVAVLEFQSVGTLEKKEAATLTVRFRALLVNTQAFKVIEREKMNEILKAQDFNMSDACNTSECAVQVGQLLGTEAMIAGDIGKIGDTYTIDVRLIDVQTGAVIQSQSRNHSGKIEGLLEVMNTIAKSLADATTGFSGKQKEVRGKTRYGGPSNALLSVIFPGLGGYFVDKNKTRAVVTTISAAGLIVYGITKKNEANKSYSDYKASVDRNEINALYNKANNANHRYYIATRAAATIWIADIIWVAFKGKQNNNRAKSGNFSFSGSGFSMNCANNELQLGYAVTF